MPDLDLPVQGYSDYNPEQSYDLPVARAIPTNIPRVIINTGAPDVDPDVIEHEDTGKKLKRIYYDPFKNAVDTVSSKIKDLVDYDRQGTEAILNIPKNIVPIGEKLLGLNGQERYQTWPEKIARSALTAIPDAYSGKINPYDMDPETGELKSSQEMIGRSLDMASFAGTGGLAGGSTDATLGSTPFLRPALKHKDKLYKGKPGQEHQDIIPDNLYEDFKQKAMDGQDLAEYNFGFVNDKGQFLTREKALEYGINTGLIDPHAGKYGALTSTLLADSSKPGTAIEAMAKTQPAFYSAVEHQVNAIPQAKMSGDQWLATLANKPGVKPEELQWTGLQDFLTENKGKPVTKEQVQEHLANNKVELKEVNKGNEKRISELENKDDFLTAAEIKELENLKSNSNTKYHSYQLPGGENYREMLMTLPTGTQKYNQFIKEIRDKHGEGGLSKLPLTKAERNTYEARLAAAEKDESNPPYKSSHWDEPNILAHVRMNDRTIDGKKSLHMEEIQSDWHQQGRDRGYIQKYKPEDLKMASAAEMTDPQRFWYVKTPDNVFQINKTKAPTFEDAKNYILNEKSTNSGGVPDAPFKKSWHELALKRMIREAAEKGYDRLSWTPGEAQASRYDLSKQIDRIQYHSDKQRLVAFDKNGNLKMDESIAPDKVSDYVGKEAAKKLLGVEPDHLGIHTLENADLKIGGEGMKGFYDQIIPKSIEKISGEKVKSSKVDKTIVSIEKTEDGYAVSHKDNPHEYEGVFDTRKEAEDFIKEEFGGEGLHDPKNSTSIHYIDIPKSLKDKALNKGFPLFSKGIPLPLMPVEGNPFEPREKNN